MPGSVRSAAGRQLAIELRRLRERSGRTVADVAGRLGWSESKLSRVETAKNAISDDDRERLLDLYRVTKADRSRLREIAMRAHASSRRARFTEALPDALDTFISLEAEAATISIYGAIVVPGLLQIPEYAGAIAQTNRESEAAFEVLTARMARQAILARRDGGPQLNVIIDEAVLRRPVGGDDVLHRQLLRLIEASQRPATTIRVLPFAVGAHAGLSGQFAILDFDKGTIQAHVFCDGLTGGVLRDGEDDVQRYRLCFEEISGMALSEDESVEMIWAIARGKRS
jgi:transcriptional regulator with XRE-family HTH domain